MTTTTVDDQTTRLAHQVQGMRACAAMIKALACASKGFSRAGVTFEKNGLLTHAMHSGQVVAVLNGGFCMQKVLDCIRSNIADHAQQVALHLKPELDALVLPAGHVLRLDMAQNLADILNRGSCRLSAQVHAAAHGTPNQIHADFQFFLGECRLLLRLKAGDRFDAGEVMINEELVAETYSGLAESAVAAVNQAISGLLA